MIRKDYDNLPIGKERTEYCIASTLLDMGEDLKKVYKLLVIHSLITDSANFWANIDECTDAINKLAIEARDEALAACKNVLPPKKK